MAHGIALDLARVTALTQVKRRKCVRWSIRWEEVFGTNKVTQNGYMTGMGVRNRAQQQFLFNEDCPTVERVLMQALETPRLRETAPEMALWRRFQTGRNGCSGPT